MKEEAENGRAPLAPSLQRTWFKLDNAAKIYPATYSRTQNHQYRWTATLSENVDSDILRSALAITMPRFPSIAVTLHRGLFWYYFEPTVAVPPIEAEKAYPLTHRSFREIRRCGFRVLVDGPSLSLEFFHAVSDGSGSITFFKSLLAEYLTQKYGIAIPCEQGVLDRREPVKAEELEDCFPKFAGPWPQKRSEVKAYQLKDTLPKEKYLTYTILSYSLKEALSCAKAHGVTLTGLMCAAMMQALYQIQRNRASGSKQREIAIGIPVNLRRLYPSQTLRNFSLCPTANINPNLGEWDFDEICQSVRCQMGTLITRKEMAACAATNVRTERSLLVRLLPLPLKNLAMKAAYQLFGNGNCCLSLSNLGEIDLPDVMCEYIRDIRCLMDAHPQSANSCAMISYASTVRMQFCRCYQEPTLEYAFYNVLRGIGLEAGVESNMR